MPAIRRAVLVLLVVAAAILAPARLAPAFAVEPDEVLDDPELEARAREISANLRCVVCQSQNIDDSNAPLARDMRLLVRERLLAGDSDQEVYDYFVARYGDYVLLKPRLETDTVFLWIAPVVIFAGGAVGAWIYLAGRRSEAEKRAAQGPAAAPSAESDKRAS